MDGMYECKVKLVILFMFNVICIVKYTLYSKVPPNNTKQTHCYIGHGTVENRLYKQNLIYVLLYCYREYIMHIVKHAKSLLTAINLKISIACLLQLCVCYSLACNSFTSGCWCSTSTNWKQKHFTVRFAVVSTSGVHTLHLSSELYICNVT